MTFLNQIPLALNIVILVAGLALCVVGWRSARKHNRASLVAWLRRGAMIVLVFAIGLTPATVAYVQRVESNLAIYFVVDGTGSMAARDYADGAMRIDGVKEDLPAIADAFPGARYSVIEVTSTSALQLPLTTDVRAVFSWADVFDREVTDYSSGSDVNRPVQPVVEILEEAERDRPEDKLVLFYLGDGESTNTQSTDAAATPDFSAWKPYVDDGAVLGYGTEEGGTMAVKPLGGTVDEEDLIIDPQTNEPAISKMNPENLSEIASQLGVDYVHRTGPGAIADIVAGIDSELRDSADTDGESVYSPIVWPMALLLTLLLLWELWDLLPKVRNLGAFRTSEGANA